MDADSHTKGHRSRGCRALQKGYDTRTLGVCSNDNYLSTGSQARFVAIRNTNSCTAEAKTRTTRWSWTPRESIAWQRAKNSSSVCPSEPLNHSSRLILAFALATYPSTVLQHTFWIVLATLAWGTYTNTVLQTWRKRIVRSSRLCTPFYDHSPSIKAHPSSSMTWILTYFCAQLLHATTYCQPMMCRYSLLTTKELSSVWNSWMCNGNRTIFNLMRYY